MADPSRTDRLTETTSVSPLQQPESLNLYKLVPTAKADDPRWDKDASYGEVLVAARSSGDARIVAAESQPDFLESNALPAEDVSTRFASAFRDEKLYTVIEVAHDRSDLQRGVLSGPSPASTIKAGGNA